jgi:hypothetical protein
MADVRKDLIDKELVDAEIMKHKKNYLDMLVSQFTTPFMKAACVKAKDEAVFSGDKERAKGLEHTISVHDKNMEAFTEAQELSVKTVEYLETLKA